MTERKSFLERLMEIFKRKPKLVEKPTEEKREVKTREVAIDLTLVRGIGPKWSEKLRAAGINSVSDLGESNPKDLAEKVGVSEKIAYRWIENAKKLEGKNNV